MKWCLLLLFALIVGIANAQLVSNPSRFEGVVTDDATHKPLPVKIIVRDKATGDILAITRCDSLGRYSLTVDSTKEYIIYLNMMNSHAYYPYPFIKPKNYNFGFSLNTRSYNEAFGRVIIKYDKSALPDSVVNYLIADINYILDNPTIKTVEIVKVYDRPAKSKIVQKQTDRVVKLFIAKGISPTRIKVSEEVGTTYIPDCFHIDIIARDK